ncbi:hypothetical protein ACTXM3_18820, partial [Glutamicibacter arilaitensis]|uniref:hypothetical protein n=1 Tax=Glutamicibacter TaxID=1742989 RepID=UPI003F8FBA68
MTENSTATRKAPETIEEWQDYVRNLKKVVKDERQLRRDANAELRKFQGKYYAERDKAELWQYRAIRYSNKLKTQRIHNASAERK